MESAETSKGIPEEVVHNYPRNLTGVLRKCANCLMISEYPLDVIIVIAVLSELNHYLIINRASRSLAKTGYNRKIGPQ